MVILPCGQLGSGSKVGVEDIPAFFRRDIGNDGIYHGSGNRAATTYQRVQGRYPNKF